MSVNPVSFVKIAIPDIGTTDAIEVQTLDLDPGPIILAKECETRPDAWIAEKTIDLHASIHPDPADMLDEIRKYFLERHAVQGIILLSFSFAALGHSLTSVPVTFARKSCSSG